MPAKWGYPLQKMDRLFVHDAQGKRTNEWLVWKGGRR